MLSGNRLWRVRRTRYSYNILGLVKKGEIEKAEEVLQSMIDRRVYPDIFAYNALIKGYVLTSDARKAFKTFNNLKKRGLIPSDISYASMFAVCSRTCSVIKYHTVSFLSLAKVCSDRLLFLIIIVYC
ncbi:PREDICTED: pentatricopeptide repeat-containing protein At1g55630-like [Amphimedon queenslandica]|uniref:Pentacotripeptide-repeat region of PRORP domain-containing protein n=1 Tax=Amphimedon queenslandica TaxID=400682 RepID=A0AAN0JAW0_AMPQE|nr:PREDICTED: pentatricopeptide repeat-containing protein At1g55630-like [Amphimedon queenslandica]|eukprot:XP_019854124.1 PREDICTED: pentatricopeptide repeat-containing protein At1g55630-like [Amphimedon queenslandica]